MIALFYSVAVLLFLFSVVAYLQISHGVVRMFDFPRLQVLSVSVFAIIAGALLAIPFPALAILVAVVAMQLYHVAPFTPFVRKMSDQATVRDKTASFSLMVANVKQGNNNHGDLLAIVYEQDPDIAIFMEVDEKWHKALAPIGKDYPHRISKPLSNSYGMLLYSRIRLEDHRIEFLLNEEIPSFHCEFVLDGGQHFNLIALHPEPPVPTNDTIGRDAEILLVGDIAKDNQLPIIVTGDLNDVAWSITTKRFLRISGLLDPRIGRGMFNTFHARFPFIRWPLDHIFHSKAFKLIDMKRLSYFGSDHFPMFYEFCVSGANQKGPTESANADDLDEKDELISKAQKQDRDTIGTDWED